MNRSILIRLLSRLDNIGVRTKLVISYFLGFVLPLIVVAVAAYSMLATQAARADEKRAQSIMDIIGSQLSGNFQSVSGLAGLLQNDELVRTMLDDWRIDKVGHLTRYRLPLRYYLDSFITAYPLVEKIYIYTTNPAIVQGGSVLRLTSEVRSAQWMLRFASRERRSAAVLHMVESVLQSRRSLSLISNMDRTTHSDVVIETYLRLDLSLSLISDLLSRSTSAGTTFLLDGSDRIIASSESSPEDANRTGGAPGLPALLPGEREYTRPVDGPASFAPFRVVGRFPRRAGSELLSFFGIGIVVTAGLGILLASFVQFAIGYSLTRRLRLLTAGIEASSKDHFPSVPGVPGADELGKTIGAYNRMTATIDRLFTEAYEDGLIVNRLAVEKRHAELEALYSKINPHFLSNSLNTIRMKALGRDERETADALKCLSRLFHYLTTWKDETISVKDETEFIRDYLALQRYRFGERYRFSVAADDDVLDQPIPRMIVQPLVENASIHGIEKEKNRGRITVDFLHRNKKLVIIVSDNGRGMSAHEVACQRERLGRRDLSGNSIGLQNVCNRISLMYGESAELSIESSEGEGTTVTLTIPFADDEESDK